MSEPGESARKGGLTYADYAALPDDGNRYQLVEGELVLTPSPNSWHQIVLGELHGALREHVANGRLGRVFLAPLDVILEDRTVLQPDLFFVSNERATIVHHANVRGAPDLAVEILSPGTLRLDRVRKLELYARFGVTHYWIVDLDALAIEEYVLEGAMYRVRSVAAGDAAFRPACFRGFEFRLGSIELPERG